MSNFYCCDCIFCDKNPKEMPCCSCVKQTGDQPYFVSQITVDLIVEKIIEKAFEEKENKFQAIHNCVRKENKND